ncbi:MAG: two-component sensor histidine kinase [Acidobacteria bacterium]|nr:MAG: two-component sensor histidine kinase [Acidobacteriota bacterium]
MTKLSIGMRLTLWYLAIFAGAQLIFGAGMWFVLRHHVYDLVDDGLESQVEDLESFLRAQDKDASLSKLQEEFGETFVLEHSGDYLQVYAGNGEWVYRSAFLQEHPLPPVEPNLVRRASFDDRRLGKRPFRFVTLALHLNGRTYTIQSGVPNKDVVEALSQFRLYLLMFAPLLFLIAAAGGYWLSRRALAPVDSIVQTARAITGTNLDSRLKKLETGDELQRLSDTLNEMLDRIERAFLRITQFTADASHELRTPISLVRTEAELALRRSRDEAEYQESLRHILSESERATSLIEELLALARADSGREMLHMRPVSLQATLRGMVDSWRQVATIRTLQFSDSLGVSESFVLADETALRRVVNILLDNAFKYTPSPGTVKLSLEQKTDKAVVVVEDTGIGIPAEEQSKVFERFYRVDKARSREMGGAGLGLSIAQWIAQQHRGIIAVESEPGKGTIFRLELPLTAAPVRKPMLA